MRRQQAYCARKILHTGQHSVAGDAVPTAASGPICGHLMPRSKTICARKPGHAGDHRSARALADHRQRITVRRRKQTLPTPAARARWRITHKLKRYGLTHEDFSRMLEAQDYACGMCREAFQAGQAVCIDHDHACHPQEKRGCKKCVRGLLCTSCNTALGIIERKYEMARTYLDTRASLVGSACSSGG